MPVVLFVVLCSYRSPHQILLQESLAYSGLTRLLVLSTAMRITQPPISGTYCVIDGVKLHNKTTHKRVTIPILKKPKKNVGLCSDLPISSVVCCLGLPWEPPPWGGRECVQITASSQGRKLQWVNSDSIALGNYQGGHNNLMIYSQF